MILHLFDTSPLKFEAKPASADMRAKAPDINMNSLSISDAPESEVRLWLNAAQAAQLRACLDQLYPQPIPAPENPDAVLIRYADEHAGEFQPSLCSMINPNAPLPLTPVEVDLLAERIAGRNTP